jgi:hypothetical protein
MMKKYDQLTESDKMLLAIMVYNDEHKNMTVEDFRKHFEENIKHIPSRP